MEKAQASANIGFEKQIWDAACVLRGNMDASEYKSVVLGLNLEAQLTVMNQYELRTDNSEE